jgi:hypothetical protein
MIAALEVYLRSECSTVAGAAAYRSEAEWLGWAPFLGVELAVLKLEWLD